MAAPRRDRSQAGAQPQWRATLDDPEEPLYTVGVVADLLGVDPQVVRGYDQRGLVSPERSGSGQRRYSRRDIERLSRAMELAGDGIPAAGIGRILTLEDRLRDHGLPVDDPRPGEVSSRRGTGSAEA